MKTRKLLIASSLTLALLLIGSFALLATAPQPLTASVKFDPDTMDLGAPGWTVKLVLVTVWFETGQYDGRNIDPKTVLIERVLQPKGGWKHTWTERAWELKGNPWVFRFYVSGSAMRELLWTIISHQAIPGPVATIPLTVTGNLYETTPKVGAAPFSGVGYITVYIPTEIPPNPPPPP